MKREQGVESDGSGNGRGHTSVAVIYVTLSGTYLRYVDTESIVYGRRCVDLRAWIS